MEGAAEMSNKCRIIKVGLLRECMPDREEFDERQVTLAIVHD
jgi:hypothetical protein